MALQGRDVVEGGVPGNARWGSSGGKLERWRDATGCWSMYSVKPTVSRAHSARSSWNRRAVLRACAPERRVKARQAKRLRTVPAKRKPLLAAWTSSERGGGS